jgi:peptidoglycan hydrolase CwlO-like protein
VGRVTLQEQRVTPPTKADLEAWLKQLQQDRSEQERVVIAATRDLDRAKRDAEQIQRNITACNAMLAALKDAGLG